MKLSSLGRLATLGALVAASSVIRAPAQDAAADKPVAVVKAATSAGIAEVMKMLDAGVSRDVVMAFIENSPNGFTLTASDLIALKERGVSDDITLGLLKHGTVSSSAVAMAPVPAAPMVPATIYVTQDRDSGRPDPESYDYFQRYYLFPRTLANVNQTLGYALGPYGFYGPQFYGPSFGIGYGYPRRFGRPGPFGLR